MVKTAITTLHDRRSLLRDRLSISPRLRFDLKVLALYALIALALLAPFASNLIPLSAGGGDIVAHMTGVLEARDALTEGQFPIRVAPDTLDGMRYPYFAFYGNLPFFLPGAIVVLLHFSPYSALKLMLGLALCFGAYFLYRSARLLQRGANVSVLAGIIFMSAPYLLADIFARFAYSETISFCLLPFVLYTALRSFLDSRSRSLPILFNGIAWTSLALSHNITFLYSSTFFMLFFLSFARRNRRYLWRLARLAMGYCVGILLALWYLVPQLTVLAKLAISATDVELLQRGLTPFGTLFSPALISPYGLGTPNLGLQIGVPITVSAGIAFYLALTRQFARHTMLVVSRLLVIFIIALLMAWDPKKTSLELWWTVLPKIFLNVQFPYRLLMFVVVWGALLSAYALTGIFRHGMKRAYFVPALVLLLMASSPFLPAIPRPYAADFTPDLGKGETSQYLLTEEATHTYAIGSVDDPAIVRVGDLGAFVRHGVRTYTVISLSTPRIVQLPALFYPGFLDVRVNNHPVAYGAVGRYAAVSLPAGEYQITVELIGIRWANRVSVIAWIAVLLIMFSALAARFLPRIRPGQPQRCTGRAIALGIAIIATALLVLPTLWLPYERRSAMDAAHRAQLAQVTTATSSPETDPPPASFSLDVIFNRDHSNPTEPLLTSGKTNAGDFVYIRYLSGDTAAIAFMHSGGKPTESDSITVTPGQMYHMEVVLDRLNSILIVSVDGHRILRSATAVYPANRGEITFGENRISGTTISPRFSGSVSVVHRGMT